MENEIKSAYELQQETQKALYKKCQSFGKGYSKEDALVTFNSQRVDKLCLKHAELLQDFRSVKEINQVMSFRFDEVLAILPTPEELDLAIFRLTELYEPEEIDVRYAKLMSFRKVLVAVQAEETVRPKSYAESVSSSKVQND